MPAPFAPYESTILALGAMAALLLVQLLVADVVGILRKHPPGTPVPADPGDLLFRASRTVANSNESISIYLAVLAFCLLGGADPGYTAYGAWAFVTARAAYAACYYGNVPAARSTAFGLSVLALLALLLIGLVT